MATGNSFRSIGFSTAREIVKEVCKAIWENLGPEPTEEMWKKLAERYKTMWHFPNCIGAIDGKHINIQRPINAGSTYYNYKGSHSIVLLAIVDVDYKFITIGRSSCKGGQVIFDYFWFIHQFYRKFYGASFGDTVVGT